MKKYQITRLLVLFIASVLTTQNFSCQPEKATPEEKDNTEHHAELAELMFHNQRYMDKMYFAGINQNWELAKFYHHEMEENSEKIIDANIMEDEKNISSLVNQLFIPSLKEMETAIQSKDSVQFIKGYKLLITTCNNCHVATEHGFIKIKMPTSPSMSNQEY